MDVGGRSGKSVVKHSITPKIALVLLAAFISSVATLIVLYAYLQNTSGDGAVFDVAGRQRMNSQQILVYALSAMEGHEEDIQRLGEKLDEFDHTLKVLEHGGDILDYTLPPAAPGVRKALGEVGTYWSVYREVILHFISGMGHGEDASQQLKFIEINTPELTRLSHQVLVAFEEHNNTVRARLLAFLMTFSGINLVLAYLGVVTVRRYVAERRETEQRLEREKREQQELNRQLQEAQEQLLQSEKMASIGQLAAGVAHEINNPVGYVNSNLGTLRQYVDDLFRLVEFYEQAEGSLTEQQVAALCALKEELQFDYLREDVVSLISETLEGVDRVRAIVKDLKDFSHVDSAEWHHADLHRGLDSTLNIVNNELKYKAEVVKEYGTLPEIMCIPSQINQVFMNLLVNAAQSMESRGTITIRTGTEGAGRVWVEIVDTGKGIPKDILNRIFNPFFTTKPVGKGTGLGLSLSYRIVERHGGRIEVSSEVGRGTTFRVTLPVAPPEQEAAQAAC